MKWKFNRNTTLAMAGAIILIVAALSIYAYNTGVLAGDPEISEEEAKQIALDHMGGGTVLSIELEKEGMSQVYEVVVENDEGVWEVEVDADSGEVLEVEEDDGDEDEDDDDDDDDEHDDDDDDNEHDDDDDDDEHDDDDDDTEHDE